MAAYWEVNSPDRLMFSYKTKREAIEFAETLTGHDYVEINMIRDNNEADCRAIFRRGKLILGR